LIGEFKSITNLNLNGLTTTNSQTLTPAGVDQLSALPNLAKLSLVCFQERGLNPGVLESVSRLRQVRDLQLYYANAPPAEYASLSKMSNLTSLSVQNGVTFGNHELLALTNLPGLARLELIDTGVKSEATNVLVAVGTLTSFRFKPRGPEADYVQTHKRGDHNPEANSP
jgi:hypothetical protein